jgi:hypothetical protein
MDDKDDEFFKGFLGMIIGGLSGIVIGTILTIIFN